MHRRMFMISTVAALTPWRAQAYPSQAFTPDLWTAQRDSSNVVILNYRAAWSLTCQIKAELIAEALADTPQYQRLTFIDVDWDTFGRSVLTERLGVRRRSTLLVMKGGTEITRLENDPRAARVRALLDAALAA